MKRLGIEIDAELHKKAKMKAYSLGITLTKYLCDLIAKDIEQPKENE